MTHYHNAKSMKRPSIKLTVLGRYSCANASWCLNNIPYSLFVPAEGIWSVPYHDNKRKQSTWLWFSRHLIKFFGFRFISEISLWRLFTYLHVVVINQGLITSYDAFYEGGVYRSSRCLQQYAFNTLFDFFNTPLSRRTKFVFLLSFYVF